MGGRLRGLILRRWGWGLWVKVLGGLVRGGGRGGRLIVSMGRLAVWGVGECVVCAGKRNGTDGFRWAHRTERTASSVLLRWIGLRNVVGIARSSSALPVTMQWSRSYAR